MLFRARFRLHALVDPKQEKFARSRNEFAMRYS